MNVYVCNVIVREYRPMGAMCVFVCMYERIYVNVCNMYIDVCVYACMHACI